MQECSVQRPVSIIESSLTGFSSWTKDASADPSADPEGASASIADPDALGEEKVSTNSAKRLCHKTLCNAQAQAQ